MIEALVAFITSAGGAGLAGAVGVAAITQFVQSKLEKRKARLEQARIEADKKKTDQDYGTSFRNELRDELKTLREELRKAEEDTDKWRSKCYEYMDQLVTVKGELELALNKIKAEAQEAQNRLNGNDSTNTEDIQGT